MFEESADGFVSRWRGYAAPVRIFSRAEGTPLLELEAGGEIVQVLERTGPYLAHPGNGKAIINPTARQVSVHDQGRKSLESTGIGKARACGLVVLREDPFLVVDVGVPLVLGVEDPLPDEATPGAWVSFETVPPIHGFVLRETRVNLPRGPEGDAI